MERKEVLASAEEPDEHKRNRSVKFEYYRVRQELYKALGKPVEGRPSNGLLESLNLLHMRGHNPASRGGKVVCIIQEGNFVGRGVALCSFSDVFCRGTGKALAYARAQIALQHCKMLDVVTTNLVAEVTFMPR